MALAYPDAAGIACTLLHDDDDVADARSQGLHYATSDGVEGECRAGVGLPCLRLRSAQQATSPGWNVANLDPGQALWGWGGPYFTLDESHNTNSTRVCANTCV